MEHFRGLEGKNVSAAAAGFNVQNTQVINVRAHHTPRWRAENGVTWTLSTKRRNWSTHPSSKILPWKELSCLQILKICRSTLVQCAETRTHFHTRIHRDACDQVEEDILYYPGIFLATQTGIIFIQKQVRTEINNWHLRAMPMDNYGPRSLQMYSGND